MVRHACAAAAFLALATFSSPRVYAASDAPRVSAMYTTWDNYYFYAGFQVNDRNVISTNSTPISQPQQDDDVEVFFDVENAGADHRTPATYQMVVSAGNGAYFSVGDNSAIPKAEEVFTYKYAAKVDGTLNDASDTDVGYTVELAIPWQELGQQGPPKPGTKWGFNAISRDRDFTATPATRFYSLSDAVKTGADVQNPSKWTKILFDAGGSNVITSSSLVFCPQVSERFPLINGSIVSGEWASVSRLPFGAVAIDAPAPTTAEEPNTTASPFTHPQDQTAPQPAVEPVAPAPVVAPAAPDIAAAPTSISLPGGGSIKIVKGGIKNPAGVSPGPTQAEGPGVNPLTPRTGGGYGPPPTGVVLAGSLNLGAPTPPHLVMAVYRLDLNGDSRRVHVPGSQYSAGQNVRNSGGKSLLADQPVDGAGPWFSGLRESWHRDQLAALRHAGIDVALIRPVGNLSDLVPEVEAFVAALKDLKNSGEDYPLVGIDVSGGAGSVDAVLGLIPDEFRAKWPVDDKGNLGTVLYVPGPGVYNTVPGETAIYSKDVGVISPCQLDTTGALIPRFDTSAFETGWSKAIEGNSPAVVINSWNDYDSGTEVAPSAADGDKYTDATRLRAVTYNGNKQWHAKYLSYSIPRTLRPKTIYTVSIRIENVGTLPWRAGEGYSLCSRWYRDGRMFDDTAPRIPLAHDIYPGQSATVNLGIVAMNGYGDNLEPGNYVLVFDLIQGGDKWFTYAGDTPLQIPVTVLGKDAPASDDPSATFLASTTPAWITSGQTAKTTVTLRNDGSADWGTGYKLVYKILTEDGAAPTEAGVSPGIALSDGVVQPGDIVTAKASVATGSIVPGFYRLHWYIVGSDGVPVSGEYDEGLMVSPASLLPSFLLSDVPQSVPVERRFTSKLALTNLGTEPWKKGQLQIGYHWYTIDGVERVWDGGELTPLSEPVAPGQVVTDIKAKAIAPETPGTYVLAWDVKSSNGAWASIGPSLVGVDPLPVIVQVTGR